MENEFINKMDDFVLSSLKEGDSSAIDSFLESSGYNFDDIDLVAEKCYKKLSFSINGQLELEKDETLLDKVANYFQDALNKNIDKPISFLRNLVEKNQLELSYRNLDKLTTDEIKEIIKDHNLLEILEELENENES